jgi:glycosyltransferase involved in cell wall biosynthesis
VATRVGGIPEIIAGPEYGVLVEPDDPEGLERALEDLLQNAEKARELGENLRQRVRTVFSWEAAYRKYRDILDGRGDPAASGGR